MQMLPQNDIASLETATLDAVAPQHVEFIDGWLLPFDSSTIGRAKSAVPLRHAHLAASTLDSIFDRYADHALPAHFRLAECEGLQPIATTLTTRGYRAVQPTRVQIASVAEVVAACEVMAKTGSTNGTVHLANAASDDWAAVYIQPEFDPIDGAHRVRALSRSPFLMYAYISDAHGPIAAGTASFSQGWASLHGMRTVERCRGQGLATRIVAALAQDAVRRGLKRMFLQVDAENQAAQTLYARLGFRTAWTYSYWRPAM